MFGLNREPSVLNDPMMMRLNLSSPSEINLNFARVV